MEPEEIRRALLAAALLNSARHGGTPNEKAVIGSVLGEHPELRGQVDDVRKAMPDVLEEVSSLSAEEIAQRLKELGLTDKQTRQDKGEERREGLPELDGWERGVVLRLAPNPNGPPSIGNARGLVINAGYRDMYRNKCVELGVRCEFILRFDDTDPKNKPPLIEAYDWYMEDADWLGCQPDRVVIASEELNTLYPIVRQLMKQGNAYTSNCSQEEYAKFKNAGEPCPHRDALPQENIDAFEGMLNGELPAGWVVRIKTQVDHPDPALRDYVALRIVDVPHPRTGDHFRVWPMLDFESAVLDHMLGITHIIRGKDLIKTEHKQRYLYDYLGWEYPKTLHWGRLRLHGYGKFSTSEMAKGIKNGEYSGWDDVRLPTLRAFRRRGYAPEAIYSSMLSLGLSETDIAFSMENLHSVNRTLIDNRARRFFFVADPVEAKLEGDIPGKANPPIFPKNPGQGRRTIQVGKSLLLAEKDLELLEVGGTVRLKDLCNVTVESLKPLLLRFESEEVRKGLSILHWCPPEPDGLSCRVVGLEGNWEGVCERSLVDYYNTFAPKGPDDEPFMVQFERFGYCRVLDVSEVGVECAWTHK